MTTPKQVLETYISSRESDSVLLAEFVDEFKELIASTIVAGKDFRRFWSSNFSLVARSHGKRVLSSQPDWESVCMIYINNTSTAGHADTAPSTSKGSTNTGSSTAGSSTASRLKDQDKVIIKQMFDNVIKDKTNLWRLSTGTVVEEKMREFGLKCSFEHPCHSLIMNPWDKTWELYFSESEIDEIMNFNAPSITPLPQSMQEYMDKFSDAQTLDELREVLLANPKHPLKEFELHWMESSMYKALDVLYYDISSKFESEVDLMERIWCFIDCAFDRVLSGVNQLQRKKLGSKMDLLFTTKIHEMGTAEAGKTTDTDSTKATVEYGIKTTKVLKDMLYDIALNNRSLLRKIRTFGFIIAGLQLLPMVMDCPAGVVCRVNRSAQWLYFPTSAQNFKSNMEALFRVVYSTRHAMSSVLKELANQPVDISFTRPKSLIPPSFTPSSESSKKRKVSDTSNTSEESF